MKSGPKIGSISNRKNGKTGERYITMVKSNTKPFRVSVTRHGSPSRSITIGYASTLENAVELRDKYLEVYG